MASISSLKTMKSTTLLFCLVVLQSSLIKGQGGNDQSSSDQVNLHSKHLILVKVWCLIILLVSTFAFGVSPYFFRWNESFLLLGTQFAGGVFLATSLIHFLSDSAGTFADLTTKTYPFAFMLASAGYVLTLLADCIVAYLTSGSKREARILLMDEGRTPEQPKEVHVDVNPEFLRTTSFGDALLLILALCFHSVFEGIAVGVSATEGEAWRNLWTISLHKMFAAISMGIALLKMLPKRPFLSTAAYSFAFAVSSPVGVGIGIAIDATTQGQTANWIYAISMGIACGFSSMLPSTILWQRATHPNLNVILTLPSTIFLLCYLE
ncbi:hypothetical protein ACB098_08G049700 [Castanea mollissima]|uniref:Uncharacterized protein n=1 Tax=Castanea mollissima TaxID=60419 RepID=A0A8J4R9W8_9ROSI|nr:hypothetical protein CMV_012209 [Castanea mollissima]